MRWIQVIEVKYFVLVHGTVMPAQRLQERPRLPAQRVSVCAFFASFMAVLLVGDEPEVQALVAR